MKKIDANQAMEELTMILMYLSRFEEAGFENDEKFYYAWKGYDFDIINKLDDNNLINQGSRPSRTKSVYITKEGKAKIRYIPAAFFNESEFL